jgi:hypothetical protein
MMLSHLAVVSLFQIECHRICALVYEGDKGQKMLPTTNAVGDDCKPWG